MARITHYASYLVGTEEVFGTAELLCGSGWLFRRDGQRQATVVSYKDANLMLFGLVDVADTQHELDTLLGGPALIACSRDEGRSYMASPLTERQTFRDLVAQVADNARAKLPQTVNGRIESAVKLVLLHDVMPQEDGSILVGAVPMP